MSNSPVSQNLAPSPFVEDTDGSFRTIYHLLGGETFEIEYFTKNGKGFYYVGRSKYDIDFPLDWALDHHNYVINNIIMCGSGPSQCENCASYGTINGIFAFYCANCNHYIYNGQRGGEGLFTGETITQEELNTRFPYLHGKMKEDICDPSDSELLSNE